MMAPLLPSIDIPEGSCLVVYDFGAGTLDATVLRRMAGTDGGFEVVGTHGLPDVGGLDIDRAILVHPGTVLANRDPDRWRRLEHPETSSDRRLAWLLREDVRTAKEMLSVWRHGCR